MISAASLSTKTLYQEIMIESTPSGISYQLRDIYSICRCCCNAVTCKWEISKWENL